jgi:hypothetical protein
LREGSDRRRRAASGPPVCVKHPRACSALAGLAAALIAGDPPLWAILLVAFVEGTGASVFGNAEPGVLRAVVPTAQMADAAGVQEVRRSAIWLAGPPLGGVLFGLGRAVPFVFDACSYAASTVALLAMRTPFQEEREAEGASLRAQIAEGLCFLWGMPFLRTCTAIFAVGNFLIAGMALTVVVQARGQGFSGGETGLRLAIFGAGTLLGSLVSPLARRLLSVRAILVMEQWTWLGFWAFVAWPDAVVLTAAMVLLGIAAPITNSVVFGLQIALTPDRLQGRVESVRTTIALAIAPLGPLVAGALLSASPRARPSRCSPSPAWGSRSGERSARPSARRRAWTRSGPLPGRAGVKGPRPGSDVWRR